MRKLVVTLLAALVVVAPALAVTGTAQAATPSQQQTQARTAPSQERTQATQKKKHKKKRGAMHRTSTWNRLAHCESTSRWHVNTGNGYYGGLQISPSTWRAYGGKRFARLPHNASKGEQIVVGKRIKNGQGWGAWPSCSRKLGLR